MARAKKCEEEFNPWPPFVDVFSSVVLVLLLFILVLIVNVAYYTQFNSKVNSESKTKSKSNNLQAGVDTTDLISLYKIQKPKLDSGGKDSLFSGGNGDGLVQNSLKTKDQKVQKLSDKKLIIDYNDNSYFLHKNAKSSLKAFVKSNVKSGKKIVLSISYPSNVLSTTMKRKITISRLIDVKNRLKKYGVKLSDIKIDIKEHEDKKYPNGYIKLDLK